MDVVEKDMSKISSFARHGDIPCNWEAEAGGTRVPSKIGLYSKALYFIAKSQKKKNHNN